jgi:flagellar hook-associated protein 1
MAGAVSILTSRMTADRDTIRVISSNIARHDIDGYTRKEVALKTIASPDGLSGVRVSNMTRTVNTLLLGQLRIQNSQTNHMNVLQSFYERIESAFGNKGQQNSYVHDMGKMIDSLYNLNNQVSPVSKRDVIAHADRLGAQIRTMGQQIQDIRTDADHEIALNLLTATDNISRIAELNTQIASCSFNGLDTVNLEDERDQAVQNLAGVMDINVVPAANNKIAIYTKSGRNILQDALPANLQFVEGASAGPGTVLNNITLDGVNISAEIQSGSFRALLDFRDTILPNLQQQLDEFTRNLRDSINALHNQATSNVAPNVLVGETFLPGALAVTQGADQVNGAGVVRLATIDQTGTMQCFKDFDLTAWTLGNPSPANTVTNLINAINAAPYAYQNVGATFAAALSPSGALQITGSGGFGVGIGTVTGQAAPQMNAVVGPGNGPTYGFSHFWGFNNLFTTANTVANTAAQVGITNVLDVRDSYKTDPNTLGAGSLSDLAMPIGATQALGGRKTDIALAMADQITQGNLTFQPSGGFPLAVTTLKDYAIRILAATTDQATYAQERSDREQAVLEDLSARAYEISGVDITEELMKTMDISSTQAITRKCLQIVFEMERDLMNLLV